MWTNSVTPTSAACASYSAETGTQENVDQPRDADERGRRLVLFRNRTQENVDQPRGGAERGLRPGGGRNKDNHRNDDVPHGSARIKALVDQRHLVAAHRRYRTLSIRGTLSCGCVYVFEGGVLV